MSYREKIIKSKFVIFDKSPLMKKLVYDGLSEDVEIDILNIFKNCNEMKNFIWELTTVIDGVIINFSSENGKNKDIVSLLLELKNHSLNFIIISRISSEKIKSIQHVLGLKNITFIDYHGKLDLRDIVDIKQKLTSEVYRIKNNRIKRSLSKVEKAIVIAASSGGPKTLEYIFENLRDDIDMPIFLVQHMPDGCTKQFADRLSKVCTYKICEGRNGEIARSNVVYVAPGGYHMEINKDKKICLNLNEPVNNVRPSADVLFCSASRVYKEGLLGIVLTGMGKDASYGTKVIKLNGGTTIAQTQRSSTVFGMPKAAIETGMVDKILSVDEIMFEILKHAGKL